VVLSIRSDGEARGERFQTVNVAKNFWARRGNSCSTQSFQDAIAENVARHLGESDKEKGNRKEIPPSHDSAS